MSSTLYTPQLIAELVNGELISEKASSAPIQHILIDSRKLIAPGKTLFFCIVGERNNAHQFINDLIKKGVKNFVVSETINAQEGINFIKVDDTLDALQLLAEKHRANFSYPVIGITGSNGKTIIKEWLFQLLREDFNIVRSPKSFNSQVGVPVSVWQMNEENTMAIFEAGISMPNEMEHLQKIINPTFGIFTNIGEAHSESFDNQVQKINEKLKLFNNSEKLLYCKDYNLLHQTIEDNENLNNVVKITWSRKTRADLQIGSVNKLNNETEIQGIYKNDFIRIKIPFCRCCFN